MKELEEQNKRYASQNKELQYKLDGVKLAKDEIYTKYINLILNKYIK